eukprot:5487999-Pyramimonas_sp.AAC.2
MSWCEWTAQAGWGKNVLRKYSEAVVEAILEKDLPLVALAIDELAGEIQTFKVMHAAKLPGRSK